MRAARYDLGFIGGGQLARMSIQAAQRMGLECLALDSSDRCPAAGVCDVHIGSINEAGALAQLFRSCRFVTLENEFVPGETLLAAARIADREPVCLTPRAATLAVTNDKLAQRQAYQANGVPSPLAIGLPDDRTAWERAVEEVGFPAVLKLRHGGYDGKGTLIVPDAGALAVAVEQAQPGEWLAEQFVPFRRELAVMVYRSASETGAFPTVETVQRDRVCDLVCPTDVDASFVAVQAVEAIDGFGLFGVELFEKADGGLLVNEIAPRPHNSGHYTLDWGGVSQFEQHVRLAMGLQPCPATGEPTAMANLFGVAGAGHWRDGMAAALAAVPGAHVHWYGKAEARPGRKMGHINVVGDECVARVLVARNAFMARWTA